MPDLDPRREQERLQTRVQRIELRRSLSADERQLAALELIADSLDILKDEVSEIRIQLSLGGQARR